MKIKLRNSEKELIVGNLKKEYLEKLNLIPNKLKKIEISINNEDVPNKLNNGIQSLLAKVNNMNLDNAANVAPKQLLSNLAVISNGLHNLNCDAYNCYLKQGEEVPNNLIKDIESVIENVDRIYIDGILVPICKKAVIEGFTEDEFEKKVSELCEECNIVDTEAVIQCVLDIFYEESISYKAM